MDEPHAHPLHDQLNLSMHDRLQQCKSGVDGFPDVRIMPVNDIGSERLKVLYRQVIPHKFESPHPDMAGGDAGQDRTIVYAFPVDLLTGLHHRQAPGSRNAEMMHGFADDVFPQHRRERGTAVATTGVCRLPRPFQLDVKPASVRPDLFPEQYGATVPQHGEMPELMPGISLRNRLRPFGNDPTGKQIRQFLLGSTRNIHPQIRCQPAVKTKHDRTADRNGHGRTVHLFRKRPVCILQRQKGMKFIGTHCLCITRQTRKLLRTASAPFPQLPCLWHTQYGHHAVRQFGTQTADGRSCHEAEVKLR